MSNPDTINISNSLTPKVAHEVAAKKTEKPTGNPKSNNSTTTVMVQTEAIPTRLDALTSLVRDKMKPGLDKPLQEELAKLLSLTPELDNAYYKRIIPLMEIAVISLLSEKPNLILAEGIHKCIERYVHRSPFQSIIQGEGSPASRVILGLGTLIYTVIPLAILAFGLLTAFDTKEMFGTDTRLLLLIATAGAVGSAVSIMVRLQDFEPLKNTDPSILFLTGFFKPIIGTAFALFVFSTLKSGAIPLNPPEPTWYYFFPALAFISGFSERFAKDMVSRAEETIVAVKTSNL
jgi:hypothetical protein